MIFLVLQLTTLLLLFTLTALIHHLFRFLKPDCTQHVQPKPAHFYSEQLAGEHARPELKREWLLTIQSTRLRNKQVIQKLNKSYPCITMSLPLIHKAIRLHSLYLPIESFHAPITLDRAPWMERVQTSRGNGEEHKGNTVAERKWEPARKATKTRMTDRKCLFSSIETSEKFSFHPRIYLKGERQGLAKSQLVSQAVKYRKNYDRELENKNKLKDEEVFLMKWATAAEQVQ